mmetsp:Transcript_1155/g.3514  ORF Transcript_1155/g.3514 Transcript_1155/m.3514 type:complete len:103 (+) Transcript_1155:124-432(+)
MELLHNILVVDLDQWPFIGATVRDHLERPQLDVCLDNWVTKLPADQPLGVEYRVCGVVSNLVLCSIAKQSFRFSPCHVRRRCPVALVVCDDLDLLVLVDPNA